MIGDFSIARLPRIEFGAGASHRLAALAAHYGRRMLLVTGGAALEASPHWGRLLAQFGSQRLKWEHRRVVGEPSPELVDSVVGELHNKEIDVVVGIGGGSVVDAAKAIAGLLRTGRSVMDYLEGVGSELPYEGPSVPLIAVPTTAGTGSEATKNAVLSVQGEAGFKKSFRDERLVPEYAVVDPELLASCPPELIAANGMDALTQLIESYVSLRANAFTDGLVLSGLRAVRDGLLSWHRQGATAADARSDMAYAALISGVALAQTGLGSVHGLASPLGAYFPIPHGVVCGSLLAEATEVNIAAMREREPENPALEKYAHVAEILCDRHFHNTPEAWGGLVFLLRRWTEHLGIPRLSGFGVSDAAVERIVAASRGSSMKTNPIVLGDAEISRVVEARL